MPGPTATAMLLGIYETLAAHNRATFETLNSTRAIVKTLSRLDPQFAATYDEIHKHCVAETAKKESETQTLIETMLRELRKSLPAD